MSGHRHPLEPALGYRFQRPELLETALTHSSAGLGRAGRAGSYERLEFLGDRVLGLVVAHLVYDRFPDEEEGPMARRHAALVQRDALARVARGLGLAEHVVMAPGEDVAGGRHNPGLLSDTCEAVIAALYLDGGIDPAEAFIRAHWTPLMEEQAAPPMDSKTALQEWAQGRGLPLPAYRETGRSGPPHAPVFTMEVAVTGHAPAQGTGTSKRAAETTAAGALLERLEIRGWGSGGGAG